MAIYYYTITKDTGFAPNPFWGYCTLACCKPDIRKKAGLGDWILSFAPKGKGSRLVCAVQVTEAPMPFGRYYRDTRFRLKQPDPSKAGHVYRVGDNIYCPGPGGRLEQVSGALHGCCDMDTDLQGGNVLISNRFWYFGSHAVAAPDNLKCLVPHSRNYSVELSVTVREELERFLAGHPAGVRAAPADGWPAGDDSWRTAGETKA